MLHLFPESVKMDRVPDVEVGRPQKRLDHLSEKSIKTPVDFYADHPTHYAGEAQHASAEKGERATKAIVERLGTVIRAVRDDDVTLELLCEFHRRSGLGVD